VTKKAKSGKEKLESSSYWNPARTLREEPTGNLKMRIVVQEIGKGSRGKGVRERTRFKVSRYSHPRKGLN